MSNLSCMLINKVNEYDSSGVDVVKKAIDFATYLHEGQYRQSGEPYIIHPLNVAYILAFYHADRDTLCAALLHDVLEDASDKTSKEDIISMFNYEVANLVDGVTKINKMNFSSKKEEVAANTRKIITGLTNDVRIIMIKLADRLHNMRTLQYKSEYKQKENALETLEIYVPLAQFLGMYQIKNELEDLSFKYLDNDKYKRVFELRNDIDRLNRDDLIKMCDVLGSSLDKHNINNDASYRIKNIYGIYKRLDKYDKIDNIKDLLSIKGMSDDKSMVEVHYHPVIDRIHDLLAIKISVKDIRDCYYSLGVVHDNYRPVNAMFKDYICNPKTNNYQSLHTTVFGENDFLIQTQIRTFDMDRCNRYGLAEYWISKPNNASVVMQERLKKYQFYDSLVEIDKVFSNNSDFTKEIKEKLFKEKVYVYTTGGEVIEMPKGSTLNDFFCKISFIPNQKGIIGIVNNDYVDDTYVLKDNDRIKMLTSAYYDKDDNTVIKPKIKVKSVN